MPGIEPIGHPASSLFRNFFFLHAFSFAFPLTFTRFSLKTFSRTVIIRG